VKRRFWHCPRLDDPGTFEEKVRHTNDRKEVPEFKANLVGSRLQDSRAHAPVLDLDFPCRLVPSTTEGHHHLYLDRPLTWTQYRALLEVMGKIGLLEPGYVDASIRRKQTFVRKPGVVKAPDAPSSEFSGKSKKKKRRSLGRMVASMGSDRMSEQGYN
jgi:hypothetical protein